MGEGLTVFPFEITKPRRHRGKGCAVILLAGAAGWVDLVWRAIEVAS